MSKLYYQIENGKVLGFAYGSDIPGDPTATKQSFDAWALESPGTRSVCVCDTDLENPATGEPKHLKVAAGKVVSKTQAEKDQVDADEASDKLTKTNARKAILDGVKVKLALTDAEMKELVGIY